MALTVVAGVGLVLLFPRVPASPVELAQPAPLYPAPVRVWPLPAAPPLGPPPAPAPAVHAEAKPPLPPPLRTRRLEMAQAARPHPERAHVVRARTAPAPPPAACRAPQSPADRLVCDRPGLAAQDREMRAAYDRALSAGADRLKVDRAQAQWRSRRDQATSETELAKLYARRIAELDRTARIKSSGGPSIA
jgi:uncharacterized protein YecT (DUF1311 family)